MTKILDVRHGFLKCGGISLRNNQDLLQKRDFFPKTDEKKKLNFFADFFEFFGIFRNLRILLEMSLRVRKSRDPRAGTAQK